MRRVLIGLCMLLCSLTPAVAQLSLNFGAPGVSIGINLPVYPRFQRVPGYPVYYAPGVNSNYFFYDGLYWVYQSDNWYASSWYNGPWSLVDPFYVPVYVLRVPVRYYRHPPAYFHGWRVDHPPRWGEHWGHSWQQSRSGWDSWNRKSAPAPAPLPTYQRQYSGNNYPQLSQQAVIQTQNYRYQPRDAVAQQHFQQQRAQAPVAQPQRAAPQRAQTQRAPVLREQQAPIQQPQRVERQLQQAPVVREKPAPRQQPQNVERQLQQAPAARQQKAPPPQAQERGPKGKGQDKGQDKGQGRDKEKGQER